MTAGAPVRALWRALIRFEPRKIVPQVAIRNTLGFTCAVILGTIFASPSTGVVAGLGALNVCYSDGLDPYRFRARRMLIATFLVGIAVITGAISAHSNLAAVAVAALWAFAAGMLVALGTTAGDLGVVTLVTLVVFAAKPLPPLEALEAGAVAVGGGLLQTLFSTFLWPLRRYQPERRIVAGIYAELADIAKAPPSTANAPPMTGQISDAQEALAPLAGDHSIEAERSVFLLVQAERIRLSLLNAGRLHRRIARYEGGALAADALGQILCRGSAALELIGRRTPTDAVIEQLTASLIAFQAFTPADGNPIFAVLLRDARRQCGTLRSQIRAAAWAASAMDRHSFTNSDAVAAADAGPGEAPQSWRLHFNGYRARLLANLSLNSTVFRHAVRMAVCLVIGDMIGRTLVLQRTYWIPMTIAIVLKPDFTGTFARGVLRVGGTIAGLVLATVLLHFAHPGIVLDIALLAIFTLLLRWIGPANYGIFVIAVSSLVVLLISVTGIAAGPVITARALNTALGGALALFAYAVWPTWEKTQTSAALADMLDSYRAYARAVMDAWQGGNTAEIGGVRLKSRRARSNALASVDRALGEPGTTTLQTTSLSAILVNSHSFVHAVMAMESRLYRNPRDPAPAWLAAFAGSMDRALSGLADILRNLSAAGARRAKLDIDTPLPGTSGNGPLETEADRVRTSLRSLDEELAKRDWL